MVRCACQPNTLFYYVLPLSPCHVARVGNREEETHMEILPWQFYTAGGLLIRDNEEP